MRVAAATRSPYPGWAFTTNDRGLPWLVPVEKRQSVGSEACVLKKSGTPPSRRIVRSPYPGWLYVTDEGGLQNLVSISNIRG